MPVLFVHGWGFDATFWSSLCHHLKFENAWILDFGFRKNTDFSCFKKTAIKIIDTKKFSLLTKSMALSSCIAVGHSMGVLWLLHHLALFHCQALISINGFPRLFASTDFPYGIDSRVLQRMITAFKKQPSDVYCHFMNRCGLPSPNATHLDHERLHKALFHLKEWDERKVLARKRLPVLALAGKKDVIVPMALSQHIFHPDNLKIKTTDGHLLPLTSPQWCARHIQSFLRKSLHEFL